MKKRLVLSLGLVLLMSTFAAAFDLPEYSDAVETKLKMPGGITYGMPVNEALAILKKRRPIEMHEGAATYQVTEKGIRETYVIKFVCGRVWGISYNIMMDDDDPFYEGLAPFKSVMEKLGEHYHGPVYGEFTFKAKWLEDESIGLESFVSRYDGKASIDITISRGDFLGEPDVDCLSGN